MSKTLLELSIELTVEIANLCDENKIRYVFLNQIIRSVSSIGANLHEGKICSINS